MTMAPAALPGLPGQRPLGEICRRIHLHRISPSLWERKSETVTVSVARRSCVSLLPLTGSILPPRCSPKKRRQYSHLEGCGRIVGDSSLTPE
jgi:hypothetical protein